MDEDDRKFLNKVLFLEPRHFSKEEIERLGFSYPPPTGWLKLARRRLNDDWNNEKDSRHLEQLLKSERNKAQKDKTGKLSGFYSNKTSFKIAGEQRLSFSSDKQFYASWEWKELRYKALQKYGAKCMLCGAAEQIVVDHIKPRSKFPSLQLEFDNMQVLCDACNKGKSNKDFTDFRPRD
jgi:hypothetical protein